MYFLLLLALVSTVFGNRVKFNEDLSQVCEGVYSKHDWGGSFKPHVSLKLSKYGEKDENIKVSYIIFEYKDFYNIGHYFEDGQVKYICDDTAIDLKVCNSTDKGKFIINNEKSNNTILTDQITKLGPIDYSYNINNTGYYCVSTFVDDNTKYHGTVNFQNAFGELSASEIPKLPAYGILTLLYGISIALFGWQFFKKRKENQILPLQRYLLAMLGLLTFDTLVIWSYYDLINRSPKLLTNFNVFYLVFLSILNASKLTFSFFLLLLISLGYGVVTVKLHKKKMLQCKILAGAHFVSSLIYLVFNYYNGSIASVNAGNNLESNSNDELWTLLPLIPISVTLCIYYVMILTSIKTTTTNLNKQRQVIKLKLYENLFKLIFASFFLIFIGIFLSGFKFMTMSSLEIIESSWKYTYFVFEFTPSIIYFIIFMGIAWLWRPTETSYMLAVSQQVASTDENNGVEFELDDLSLMSHDSHPDEENHSFDLDPPEYENDNTLFELGDSDHEHDDRLKDDSKDNSTKTEDEGKSTDK
ncbi:membrane protein Ptm1p [[Candida] jaroonii]|uniref:Membrane protein Ptm1p n=1 Tax=[Candida] jaroonii TaxID=467808 RepID=A0ACA9Y3S4_9ASCO|nr:membrane protein Ptm1p [[Candida] jaroonii]